MNAGLTTPRILSLTVAGTTLLAGSQGGGVWRRPLIEVILDVEETRERPIALRLEQNYPNPFNPTTNIGFRIADYGLVTLKLFDVLGREVATIVNEVKQAGLYTVQFSAKGGDAGGLSSGVYFYRLQVGNVSETRKMILAR